MAQGAHCSSASPIPNDILVFPPHQAGDSIMTQITVTDELARAIADAGPPILIVDSRGRELGQIMPIVQSAPAEAAISDAEWAEIKRRMAEDDGTRFTWAEVKEHLRSLAPE
jgi:hypothetical protein